MPFSNVDIKSLSLWERVVARGDRVRVMGIAAVLVSLTSSLWAIPSPLVDQKPAANPPAKATPPPAPSGPLNVTIQGELKGQIPLERIRPPIDTPFKDLVGLSRSGQTQKVLKESVGYLDLEEQMKLLTLKSHLVKQATIGGIPTYPFFVIRNPVYKSPNVDHVEFQILDAGNQVIKTMDVPINKYIVTWDGYGPSGDFLLRARDIYLPLFRVTRPSGQVETLAADGVRFDAVRYGVGGEIIIELYNGALYPEDLASFSDNAAIYLREVFDELRMHSGAPFEVTLYDEPRYENLAKERAGLWRERLAKELLKSPDSFSVQVQATGSYGPVTRIHVARTGR